MPSGVCSIKLQYDQVHKFWGNFLFNRRVVLISFMRLVASTLGCSSILSAYLWLNLLISSLTYGTFRSWCRVSLVTYQGTLILRYLFWNLCSISMFELEALLHSWAPQVQMGLRIVLYKINLFSVDNCDLLASSQYILPNWIPSCFHLVNMCFLQFSLRSRYSPKYLENGRWTKMEQQDSV